MNPCSPREMPYANGKEGTRIRLVRIGRIANKTTRDPGPVPENSSNIYQVCGVAIK
jgi:hypothetical protein